MPSSSAPTVTVLTMPDSMPRWQSAAARKSSAGEGAAVEQFPALPQCASASGVCGGSGISMKSSTRQVPTVCGMTTSRLM